MSEPNTKWMVALLKQEIDWGQPPDNTGDNRPRLYNWN